MINSNQKTGSLKIEADKRKGQLLFNEGELVDAVFNDKDAEEAFYEVLALKNGHFKFVQGLSPQEMRHKVVGGFMGMLMEGMKRLDDQEA
jgi:hypothetical protein